MVIPIQLKANAYISAVAAKPISRRIVSLDIDGGQNTFTGGALVKKVRVDNGPLAQPGCKIARLIRNESEVCAFTNRITLDTDKSSGRSFSIVI